MLFWCNFRETPGYTFPFDFTVFKKMHILPKCSIHICTISPFSRCCSYQKSKHVGTVVQPYLRQEGLFEDNNAAWPMCSSSSHYQLFQSGIKYHISHCDFFAFVHNSVQTSPLPICMFCCVRGRLCWFARRPIKWLKFSYFLSCLFHHSCCCCYSVTSLVTAVSCLPRGLGKKKKEKKSFTSFMIIHER